MYHCTCRLSDGCSPWNLCLEWECPALCDLLVRGLCVGCGRLAFVVSLLVGFGGCMASVMPIWRGLVFSLSGGCDMMYGLLPQIYPYNFVSYISLKILCTLSVEPLHFFLSSFLCLAVLSGDFRELCHSFFFS